MPAQYNAADYDGWAQTTLQSVGIGAGNIQLNQPYITVAGRKVQPFSVGSSLLIDNLTAQETAVLTAVTLPRSNSFLRLQGTFTKAHGPGVLVRSATAGLQEAVNDASNQGGGLVIIDQNWLGTTAIIALLTGNTTVGLLDIRNGGLVSMTWNGSAYVAATSSSPIQVATVTLTAAQLKALKATPVQVIAAPGAGKFINVVSATAQLKFGTTPYTTSTELLLFHLPAFPAEMAFLSAGTCSALLGAGVSSVGAFDVVVGSGGFDSNALPQSQVDNQPLMVGNRDLPEFTLGDGILILTVYYSVVTLQ